MNRHAIISVYDKTGLEKFARSLVGYGVSILSTGGTAKFLGDHGVAVRQLGDFTGQVEILEGRVKTLHPKVHGGILARRDRHDDLAQLKAIDGELIDFVVVNLYPFVNRVREIEAKKDVNHENLIEDIDIGGPTLLRAAAKNCRFVVPICDPTDYDDVLEELHESGDVSLETRQYLAAKVFTMTAAYDGMIARYFSLGEILVDEHGNRPSLAPVQPLILKKVSDLRYGENPHQAAALYDRVSVTTGGEKNKRTWKQLQGKEISYNNLLDAQAALLLAAELGATFNDRVCAAIIKHMNPCGVAIRASSVVAFEDARSCDPISAFGGIVAINGEIDGKCAERITEGFVEVVLASSYHPDALAVFSAKKNIRVIETPVSAWLVARGDSAAMVIREFGDSFVLQETDAALAKVRDSVVATEAKPTASQIENLELAWVVSKHVKSNAIVITKDLKTIGVGAGQMSRVDSARLALDRARAHEHDPSGAVSASDAFLPFPDTLEILAAAGVAALIQPGGSLRDGEVLEVANKLGVVMITTGERHFRH